MRLKNRENLDKPRAQVESYTGSRTAKENLRRLRIERGIRKKARQLVAAHLLKSSLAEERVFRVSDLVRVVNELANIAPEQSNELGSIEVNLVRGPGRAIFVTEELIQALRPQHEVLTR